MKSTTGVALINVLCPTSNYSRSFLCCKSWMFQNQHKEAKFWKIISIIPKRWHAAIIQESAVCRHRRSTFHYPHKNWCFKIPTFYWFWAFLFTSKSNDLRKMLLESDLGSLSFLQQTSLKSVTNYHADFCGSPYFWIRIVYEDFCMCMQIWSFSKNPPNCEFYGKVLNNWVIFV